MSKEFLAFIGQALNKFKTSSYIAKIIFGKTDCF